MRIATEAERKEYADHCISESKMRTYVDMFAKFRLLKKDAVGKFKPLRKNDVPDLSVGGFLFEIGEKSVPFDFKATAIHFEEDVLYYESGYGPFVNAHYLDECFEDEYAELGIATSDLTASVLASTTRIQDFYVDFCSDTYGETGVGDNQRPQSDLRLEIIEVVFSDENANSYEVSKEVIRCFNAGINGGDFND